MTCSQVYLHYNRATRFDITMPSTNSVNELLVMQRTVHKTGTDLRHMYKHETLLQKKKKVIISLILLVEQISFFNATETTWNMANTYNYFMNNQSALHNNNNNNNNNVHTSVYGPE
jgi:hypothetical protein